MNMADTGSVLEAVRLKAREDPEFRKKLVTTYGGPNALTNFCSICSEAGFPLSDMDVIEYGEGSYAAMRRSTNGGGENSPLLFYEDDPYEMLIEELRSIEEPRKENR